MSPDEVRAELVEGIDYITSRPVFRPKAKQRAVLNACRTAVSAHAEICEKIAPYVVPNWGTKPREDSQFTGRVDWVTFRPGLIDGLIDICLAGDGGDDTVRYGISVDCRGGGVTVDGSVVTDPVELVRWLSTHDANVIGEQNDERYGLALKAAFTSTPARPLPPSSLPEKDRGVS